MPHRLTRRSVIGTGAGALLARPARAAYPTQPVRIVVPWNAGGPADVVIRALAPAMAPALGQPVVIENRPGANGAIGTQAVARALPDGHTLVLGTADTHSINPMIYPRLAYDAVADFQPVSLIVHAPCVLVARSGFGVDDVQGFIAKVRAQPGAYTYATWGIGSISHLAMESLSSQAGLRMTHVPFTGGAPAGVALAAGQVDAAFLNAGPAEALARNGSVRVLAVGGDQRLPLLPGVVTLAERALPVNASTWFALLGPARMPAPVTTQIAAAVATGITAPAVQELFRTQAVIADAQGPEHLRRFIADDVASRAALVRTLAIRLE